LTKTLQPRVKRKRLFTFPTSLPQGFSQCVERGEPRRTGGKVSPGQRRPTCHQINSPPATFAQERPGLLGGRGLHGGERAPARRNREELPRIDGRLPGGGAKPSDPCKRPTSRQISAPARRPTPSENAELPLLGPRRLFYAGYAIHNRRGRWAAKLPHREQPKPERTNRPSSERCVNEPSV